MLMYSRLTSVSTQPGGRPTIVFSGDVSSTRQHSTRGTPLKEKRRGISDVPMSMAENGIRVTQNKPVHNTTDEKNVPQKIKNVKNVKK